MDQIMVRCHSCHGVNRIPEDKIDDQPVCGRCKRKLEIPEKPLDIVSSQFQEAVLDHPGAVLLDLWSPGCVYCMQLMPVMDKLAKRFKGKLQVVRVDVSKYPDIAAQYKIRGVPFLALYNRGKLLGSIPGAPKERELLNWVFQHLGW